MPEIDYDIMREFLYSLIDWADARAVLDVGCGRGHDLRQMVRLARKGARLVGMDSMASSIDGARAETQDARCAFSVADASKGLPFGNGEFDVVYSCNLLECIPDKDAFPREMHRVLRPRGQVVCAHWDMDSQLIDGDDKNLVRKIVQTFSDWEQAWMADCDGWMGRRLWRTFQHMGLFEGEIRPYVLTNTRFEPRHVGYDFIRNFEALVRRGMITQQEYDAFYATVERLAERGEYFYSITMYAYVGRKV